MSKRALTAALFFVGLITLPLSASPITFSFTGSGSGTVGATAFTNAGFTVLINANTTDLAQNVTLGNLWAYTNLAGTINIAGPGLINFTAPLFVFGGKGNNTIGYGNFSQGNMIASSNPGQGVAAYDMISAFGPISFTNSDLGQFHNIGTNLGSLAFTSMSTVSLTSTLVPEPATGALLGISLLLCFAVSRYKLSARPNRNKL